GPASALVTDRAGFADTVDREIAARHTVTLNSDRVREALEGPQSAIVLVDDIDAGLRVVDAYAAEHLEVQTRNSAADAARVRNAGAIFVGAYSPVPLGDYAAGSNHVLPTSGTARHSSGLSVQTFLRGIHVVDYDEAALKEIAPAVVTLADAERLPAHGEAVRARFADLPADGATGAAERPDAGAGQGPTPPARDSGSRTCRCARTSGAAATTVRPNSTSRCSSTPTRTRTRPAGRW